MTTVEYLRQVSDERLYRRNAFRLTGLGTGAGPREVRERQKKAAALAAVGATSTPSAAAEVRAAFEVLSDPRRRLVHELFWLWGEDTTACGCEVDAHERHDRAVRAHAAALEGDGPWVVARASWVAALDDAATWAHLRARVAAVDDPRRLDDADVDGLRDHAPRALVATVVACAATSGTPREMRAEAERWPLDPMVLADLVLAAVAPRVATVEARLAEARERLETDPLGAARRLRSGTVADLAHLEALAPHHRFPRLADLREDVAVLLNNAALCAVEQGRDRVEALDVFADAGELATTPRTRSTIRNNRASVLHPAPAAVRPEPPAPRHGPVVDSPPEGRERLLTGAVWALWLAPPGGVGLVALWHAREEMFGLLVLGGFFAVAYICLALVQYGRDDRRLPRATRRRRGTIRVSATVGTLVLGVALGAAVGAGSPADGFFVIVAAVLLVAIGLLVSGWLRA